MTMTMMMMMMIDDDNDDDAVLYTAVTPCYSSMLGALGRVVSFEACCRWALVMSVLITRRYPTILIYCTELHFSFGQ